MINSHFLTAIGSWGAAALVVTATLAAPPTEPTGLHVRRGLSAHELHVVCDPVPGASAVRFHREGAEPTAWTDSTRGVFTDLEPGTVYRFRCEARNADGETVSAEIARATLGETTVGHGTLNGGNLGGLYRPTYRVTSLGDHDRPGTLRYGLSRGAAYIVFDTAGTIQLRDKLLVTSAHVTLDAASAGGRVILVPHPGDKRGSNAKSGLLFDERMPERAHHVIVDGLTIVDGRKDNLAIGGDGTTSDPNRAAFGIVIRNSVILRAGDGNLDVSAGAHHVTLQGNIYGENVKNNLLSSSSVDSIFGVTVFHNLIVEGKSRNPQTQGRADSVLVANNVILNYGSYAMRTQCRTSTGIGCASPTLRVDIIGNVFLPKVGERRYDAIRHRDATERGVYTFGNWCDSGVVNEYGGAAEPRVARHSWIDSDPDPIEVQAWLSTVGTESPTARELAWMREASARVASAGAGPDDSPPRVVGTPRAWRSCPDSLRVLVEGGKDDRTRSADLWYRWYIARRGAEAPTDSSIWVDKDSYEWGGFDLGERVLVWVRVMDAAGNVSPLSKVGRAETKRDTKPPDAIETFSVIAVDPATLEITINDRETNDNCTLEKRYTFYYHLSTNRSREDAVRRGPYPATREYVGGKIGYGVVHVIDELDSATEYTVWPELVDASGNSRVSKRGERAMTPARPEDLPPPDPPSAFRVRARGNSLLVEGLEVPSAANVEVRLYYGTSADTSSMKRTPWSADPTRVVTGLPRNTRVHVRGQARRPEGAISAVTEPQWTTTGTFTYVAPPPVAPVAWRQWHHDRLRWVWKDPGGSPSGYRLLWGLTPDPSAATDSVQVPGTGADSTPHAPETTIYAWVRTLAADAISELSAMGQGKTAPE
jgi:hypothetical protein